MKAFLDDGTVLDTGDAATDPGDTVRLKTFARKGIPDTFDAAGSAVDMARVRALQAGTPPRDARVNVNVFYEGAAKPLTFPVPPRAVTGSDSPAAAFRKRAAGGAAAVFWYPGRDYSVAVNFRGATAVTVTRA